MTIHPHTPATTAVVPSTPRQTRPSTRQDGWTRQRMSGFLEKLVETASVSLAAQSVGMTRQTAYRLRARLIGQPFDHAWEAALEFGLQQLHHEALDRAMNGVPVPIFHGGEQVGERRVYPEGLTRFLLDNPNARPAARDPNVRAAALTIWNPMMQRVRTGPAEWTSVEIESTKSLAEDILNGRQASDNRGDYGEDGQLHDKSAISDREYEVLAQKLRW